MIDRIDRAYAASDYDFRTTAKPDDVLQHLFPAWVPYYRLKAAISQVLQPATILEIGVRHGYGAAAFLHGAPGAHYTGIDIDDGGFGGEPGAIEWARRILPADRHTLIIGDSQKMTRLPGGTYDLVHVDGQQDEAGTFHDLVLAVRQARHILVDGYFWTQENFRATNDFLWKFREDIAACVILPGYAGEMLITVKPDRPLAPGTASTDLQALYSTEYFLGNCGGWEFFEASRRQILQDGRLRSMADLLFAAPAARVLDIGAGRGELTVLAALAGCEVTAVDYSPDAINILTESLAAHPTLAGRVRCVCADATQFADSSRYDVVLAGDVIEHLNPAELERFYQRVSGWLSPTGRFVVHTFPNRWFYDYAHRWRREAARKLGAQVPANPRSRYELLMHINEQSPRVLRRSLQRHFPHVQLWFGSPEDPGGSLLRRCRPRELAEYRDLYAVASPAPVDPARLRALFSSASLSESDFPLTVVGQPEATKAGTSATWQVRIANRSTGEVLASRPPHPVYLSSRWYDEAGQLLPGEGWRNVLTPALVPGREQVYAMQIMLPARPGVYQLVIALVQETIFWQSDRHPGFCPRLTIHVH